MATLFIIFLKKLPKISVINHYFDSEFRSSKMYVEGCERRDVVLYRKLFKYNLTSDGKRPVKPQLRTEVVNILSWNQ